MDKKLGSLLAIFVIVFAVFIGFVLFNQPIRTFTRASEELVPSSESSLIFAWPLNSKADGLSKVQINVFIRNSKNYPLNNKKVNLTTTLGNITNDSDTTDKSGKATFSLVSNSPGIAEVKAFVDNQIQIKQTVTVKFD